jgi:hypothetical protein
MHRNSVPYSGAMTTSRLARPIAALTIACTALLGLTACSGIPFLPGGSAGDATTAPRSEDASGDDGQSTAAACQLVQETITEATDEFENVSSEDPGAVVDAMNAAADRLADMSSEITNDEVAAVLPSLQEMFQNVADVMGAIAEGDVSKLAEMEELGTTFQETGEKFQELCAP